MSAAATENYSQNPYLHPPHHHCRRRHRHRILAAFNVQHCTASERRTVMPPQSSRPINANGTHAASINARPLCRLFIPLATTNNLNGALSIYPANLPHLTFIRNRRPLKGNTDLGLRVYEALHLSTNHLLLPSTHRYTPHLPPYLTVRYHEGIRETVRLQYCAMGREEL